MEASQRFRTVGAIAAAVPAVILWLAAAAFCLRWLSLFSADRLTFGAGGGGAVLLSLWVLVPLLALVEIGLAVQSVRGKMPLRLHLYMAAIGFVALFMVMGD